MNYKFGDKVYIRHSYWNEWYEGIVTKVIELAPDLFEYSIHHSEYEYYRRHSTSEDLVSELPENTEFEQMGIINLSDFSEH